MFGRPTSIVELEAGPHHEVIVVRAASTRQERLDFLHTNCRGVWADDWMHGDGRSDPPEIRAQARYLFSDQAAAAMFRVRFG